jgi:hypothetical protein
MKRAPLWMAVAIVLLLPSTAHADLAGWIAWLEELSGPGPFHGAMFSVSVRCWHKGSNKPQGCGIFEKGSLARRGIFDKPEDAKKPENAKKIIDRTLEVSFGFLTSGDNPRFNDLVVSNKDTSANHEPVHAYPVNTTFLFRPHQSIDIGPGMGIVAFSGKDVHAGTRFVLIPVAARWRPGLAFERSAHSTLARIICLEFHTYYFTQGFNASDFGTSTGSTFTARRELRGNVGISIDFGDLQR